MHQKIAYFWKNFLLFNFFQKKFFYHKKLPPFKPILTLPTWGQICIVLAVEPFEIKNFDLGHPVLSSTRKTAIINFKTQFAIKDCGSSFRMQSCLIFAVAKILLLREMH